MHQFLDAFIKQIPSIFNSDKELKQAFDLALELGRSIPVSSGFRKREAAKTQLRQK
jgi:hypothetical protein